MWSHVWEKVWGKESGFFWGGNVLMRVTLEFGDGEASACLIARLAYSL